MYKNVGALRPLQPSNSGSSLVGNFVERKGKAANEKISKFFGRKSIDVENYSVKPSKRTQRGFSVLKDVVETRPQTVQTEVSIAVNELQTNDAISVDDVKSMILSRDAPPKKYYELLAEERRRALAEALQENLELCQEVARTKEESRQLRARAEEAESYVAMVKEAMEEAGLEIEEDDAQEARAQSAEP